MNFDKNILSFLERSTKALETLSKSKSKENILITKADGYLWNADELQLIPVDNINAINLKLLKGIDHTKEILLENTIQFAKGFSANNVLLWGARGMGKSSLIKAVHKEVSKTKNFNRLILIEIFRDDINKLQKLISELQKEKHQFIIFCDDLSFDNNETNYKSLKTVLDGGIMKKSDNILFYATSNRRHLMPRSMIENESSTSISPSESAEEKISLSDRFGLWLGFYQCSQETYLLMIEDYIKFYKIDIDINKAKNLALEWSITRGSRSGRVAWQFIQNLAGQLKKNI